MKYYYSATWNTSEKLLFNWKEEVSGDFESLVKTFLDRERVIKLLADFIMFTRQDDELKKVILRPHQIRAVSKIAKRAEDSTRKRGLIWHTQGSGKSLTMVFYTGKLVLTLNNPSIVLLTDRNDLDDQLFGVFSRCSDILRQTPVQAGSRDELKKLLSVVSGGIIFTTIQKFFPDEKGLKYPKLSDRSNIIVIADEAHSSQTGEAAAKLKAVLSAEELQELADGGEISTEDILAVQMESRAAESGITYVAFTATPKAKTLELFGRLPN